MNSRIQKFATHHSPFTILLLAVLLATAAPAWATPPQLETDTLPDGAGAALLDPQTATNVAFYAVNAGQLAGIDLSGQPLAITNLLPLVSQLVWVPGESGSSALLDGTGIYGSALGFLDTNGAPVNVISNWDEMIAAAVVTRRDTLTLTGSDFAGVYYANGIVNGRMSYFKPASDPWLQDQTSIFWTGSQWYVDRGSYGNALSGENVPTLDQTTTWFVDGSETPTTNMVFTFPKTGIPTMAGQIAALPTFSDLASGYVPRVSPSNITISAQILDVWMWDWQGGNISIQGGDGGLSNVGGKAGLYGGGAMDYGGNAEVRGGISGFGTLGGDAIVQGGQAMGLPGYAYLIGGSGDLFAGDAIVKGGTSYESAGNAVVTGGESYFREGGKAILKGGSGSYDNNGGDVLISGGTPGENDGYGESPQPGKIRVSGDMILSNNLTVVSGTIRIVPAGDLSMGSYTNAP